MPGVVRMVGRYEVVRQIGRGGMAVVHLARQVGTHPSARAEFHALGTGMRRRSGHPSIIPLPDPSTRGPAPDGGRQPSDVPALWDVRNYDPRPERVQKPPFE